MSTLVFLHAHPDDEASQTSGMMAMAADQGHRVVEIFATNGDLGEAAADLAEGQSVVDYRHGEAARSAAVIGVQRVEWLGYRDSGMTGWPDNETEGAFCRADVDEAAAKVAAILDEEDADVFVHYDWHGNYGHPDHIQVHRVGTRALELARRRPRELQETMNRDANRRAYELGVAAGIVDANTWNPDEMTGDDGLPTGSPESEISWAIVLSPEYVERKRRAMQCHASQTSDIGFMLAMAPQVFAAAFGREYLIEPGLDQPVREAWPFDAAALTPAESAGGHPETRG